MEDNYLGLIILSLMWNLISFVWIWKIWKDIDEIKETEFKHTMDLYDEIIKMEKEINLLKKNRKGDNDV